jgi:hypothetical protein
MKPGELADFGTKLMIEAITKGADTVIIAVVSGDDVFVSRGGASPQKIIALETYIAAGGGRPPSRGTSP